MNEGLHTAFQIILCVFAIAGAVWGVKRTIKILSKTERKKSKAGAVLILDVDFLGDGIEYTVRKIESCIGACGCGCVKKILLVGSDESSEEQKNICRILSDSYENLTYIKDNPSHRFIRFLSDG